MKIVLVFAPVFMEWGREIVRRLREAEPQAEIIAVCMTSQTAAALKADSALDLYRVDDIEATETHWLDTPAPAGRLEGHEKAWGADAIKRILIADRQAGGGYVSGGPLPASALRAKVNADSDATRRYCCGLMDYLSALFEKEKPAAVLSYVVAGAMALGLAEGAARYGVHFYNFVHARIGSRVIMDTSPLGLFDPVRKTLARAQTEPALLEPQRTAARAWLADYRAALDQMPEYEQRNRARLDKNRQPHVIAKNTAIEAAKAVLYPFLRGQRPFRGEPGWQKTWRALAWPLGAAYWRGASLYAKRDTVGKYPYVYFALHVEPEASTMVVSPYHTNQLAIIEALSKAMPVSWQLVVKEHPSMLGKRPLGFYRRITAMPGVCLAAPYENSLQLVKGAALTATITGTVAWEAVLLGRPALVLGNSPFLVLGQGITHCPDLSALPFVLPRAAAAPSATDERLVDFIAALFRESVDFPLGILWDSPDDEYLSANRAVTDYVVETLLGKRG